MNDPGSARSARSTKGSRPGIGATAGNHQAWSIRSTSAPTSWPTRMHRRHSGRPARSRSRARLFDGDEGQGADGVGRAVNPHPARPPQARPKGPGRSFHAGQRARRARGPATSVTTWAV